MKVERKIDYVITLTRDEVLRIRKGLSIAHGCPELTDEENDEIYRLMMNLPEGP